MNDKITNLLARLDRSISMAIGPCAYSESATAIRELVAQRDVLLAALEFYAEGHHFILHDANAWETISGEPQNFQEDEANTATVEDGSVARAAIARVADHIPDAGKMMGGAA